VRSMTRENGADQKLSSRDGMAPHSVGWVYSPTVVAFHDGSKTVGEYTHPTQD
jgi:hypothetical protein